MLRCNAGNGMRRAKVTELIATCRRSALDAARGFISNLASEVVRMWALVGPSADRWQCPHHSLWRRRSARCNDPVLSSADIPCVRSAVWSAAFDLRQLLTEVLVPHQHCRGGDQPCAGCSYLADRIHLSWGRNDALLEKPPHEYQSCLATTRCR